MGGISIFRYKDNSFITNRPMEQNNVFNTKKNNDGEIQVQLNNKYFLKPNDKYYQTIEWLVQDINSKNKQHQHDVFKELGLTYFCSIEFQLGKHKMDQEKCMICLEEFQIKKEIENQLGKHFPTDIFQLQCSHRFHGECIINMIGEKKWAKCPICSTIFGQMIGDQPQGKITITVDKNQTCPGYPKGVIIINYTMHSGTRNGVKYPGTNRTGYLPNTKEGQEVCQLLQLAFNRKLIFTIGTSVTTGLSNQIVWNGIHHKTSLNGGAAHFGYPDQTYLKRVKEELALKGVRKH